MDAMRGVAEVLSALRTMLEAETPVGDSARSFLDLTVRLRDSVQPVLGGACTTACDRLAERAHVLERTGDLEAHLLAGVQLESTLACIGDAIADNPEAKAQQVQQGLARLLQRACVLAAGTSGPDWNSFPDLISTLAVVRRSAGELAGLVGTCGCGAPRNAAELNQLLESSEARLLQDPCAMVASLTSELRWHIGLAVRQDWCFLHEDADDPSLAAYTNAWREMLLPADAQIAAEQILDAVSSSQQQFRTCEVPDLDDYLDEPESLIGYGLANLIPPAPYGWEFSSETAVQAFLRGQLGQWYMRPFRDGVSPVEMISTVLKFNRPLYYERILLHSIAQHRLVQHAIWLDGGGVSQLETLAYLEDFFNVMLDGYLLRKVSMPNLRRPGGWIEYLEVLIALHFAVTPQKVVEARKDFLARRGFDSGAQLLESGRHGEAFLN
jgi:hypothetical protein